MERAGRATRLGFDVRVNVADEVLFRASTVGQQKLLDHPSGEIDEVIEEMEAVLNAPNIFAEASLIGGLKRYIARREAELGNHGGPAGPGS